MAVTGMNHLDQSCMRDDVYIALHLHVVENEYIIAVRYTNRLLQYMWW